MADAPQPDGAASWLAALSPEDIQFLRRFLLSSGSLKAVAEEYGVSYPTVRGRLDRLIEKVKVAEASAQCDAFERALRLLVADAQLSESVARSLLAAHRETFKSRKGS